MKNNFPESWTETTLSEVVFFQEGPGLRTFQMGETGIPFLNIRTFNNNETLNKSKCKFVKIEEFKNKYEHFLLNEGDIVVSSSGTLGKTIVIRKEDLPVMLNTSVIRFRSVSEKILTQKYLKYFLKSHLFFQQIQSQKTGMAIDNYGPSHLQIMQIVVPPLSEQHRIVEKLDAVTLKVEANNQRLEKIPTMLKRFRQSVLASAVSGKLTHKIDDDTLPKTWKLLQGKDVFEFITSGSRGWAEYYSEKGKLFVRVTNLDYDTIKINTIPSKNKFVTPPKNAEGTRTKVRDNDILISITGDVGMVGLVEENFGEAYINQHVCLARPRSEFYSKYIAYFISAKNGGRKYFEEVKRGATKSGLVLGDIKSLPIPIPPINEQIEIVKKIEGLFAFADKLETQYLKAKSMLDKFPQSILAKAFRGELVPQDPNDEPASELLKRIKEEKEKIFKKTKQK